MKNWICWPHIAIEGVLTRQKCAENGAQLYGPRVSNFLSHRIVKSLICMNFGKFEFQCTRDGPQIPMRLGKPVGGCWGNPGGGLP